MFVGLDLRGVVDEAMHVLALTEDQVRSCLHRITLCEFLKCGPRGGAEYTAWITHACTLAVAW